LETKADGWFEKIANKPDGTEAMIQMMEENLHQSKKNSELFKHVFEMQTTKLTAQLQKNSKMAEKSMALKGLMKLDLSKMLEDFQEKAKKKIEEELGSILKF